MNILPKKSWHVRSRDNIARVKRDEAQAAEEEKKKEARIALAEQEARTEKLRLKARNNNSGNTSHGFDQEVIGPQPLPDVASTGAPSTQTLPRTHINFFSEIESGSNTKTSNKDHEAEKKQEQEAYEKKIGLLVGLGQSAIESQTVKPWYQQKRECDKTSDATSTDTNEMKRKASMDPMNDMLRYLGKKPKTDTQTSNHQHPSKEKEAQPKGGLPGTTSLMSMFSKYKNKSREEENGKERKSHKRHREKKRKKHRKLKESRRDSRRHSHKKSHKKHRKHSRHYSDSSSSESEDTRREARLSRRRRKSHKRDRKHKRKSSRTDSDSGSDSNSQSFSGSESDENDKHKPEMSAKPAPTIEQLRAERLRREAAERTKTERFLAGKPLVEQPVPEMITDKLDGKYNSQFNPHLARKHQPKEPMF